MCSDIVITGRSGAVLRPGVLLYADDYGIPDTERSPFSCTGEEAPVIQVLVC
jgi:hypothetical protein